MVNDSEPVSTSYLSHLLGISAQSIARLARSGVFKKVSRGLYPLGPSLRAYAEFTVASLAARRGAGTSDRVRDARAAEIEQRMAREDKHFINLDEAMTTLDDVIENYLQSIVELPAQITQDPRERQRIEAICDAEHQRLRDRFRKIRTQLATGADDDVEAD